MFVALSAAAYAFPSKVPKASSNLWWSTLLLYDRMHVPPSDLQNEKKEKEEAQKIKKKRKRYVTGTIYCTLSSACVE